MGNRAAATEFFVKFIDDLIPGSPNTERVRRELTALTDEEFEAFIVAIEAGEDFLTLIVPNGANYDVSVERNLELGDKYGLPFFERYWTTDQSTGVEMLSNKPGLIMDQMQRKQKQMLKDKISIPDDNNHVDELTGQPTGPSKGSGVSNPQAMIMNSRGLNSSARELVHIRGGDAQAFNLTNRRIFETGSATIEEASSLGSRTKASQMLSVFLNVQHLDNNT